MRAQVLQYLHIRYWYTFFDKFKVSKRIVCLRPLLFFDENLLTETPPKEGPYYTILEISVHLSMSITKNTSNECTKKCVVATWQIIGSCQLYMPHIRL